MYLVKYSMKCETLFLNVSLIIQHYKSNDISHTGINDFQRGLEAMTTILVDQPNLMLSWKDVSCIFTSKVHSITILK